MTKSASKTASKTGSVATGRGGQTKSATNSKASTKTTSASSAPKLIDFEVSAPLIVDKSWSFRHNDERITYEQYLANVEEHKRWIADQQKASTVEEDPIKRKKKK